MDKKAGVFLALIVSSTAFDTVDHNILLDFLKDTIGINGTAWDRFKSYLSGRTQHVSVENVMSEVAELLYIWSASGLITTGTYKIMYMYLSH